MSVNESVIDNEPGKSANSEISRPQKRYKTDAEVALLEFSRQPRILDLDDVWKEDVDSTQLEEHRAEDLVATMIYYTHGLEGIKQLQTQRMERDKSFSYKIQTAETPNREDSRIKKVHVYRVRDFVQVSRLSTLSDHILTESRFW